MKLLLVTVCFLVASLPFYAEGFDSASRDVEEVARYAENDGVDSEDNDALKAEDDHGHDEEHGHDHDHDDDHDHDHDDDHEDDSDVEAGAPELVKPETDDVITSEDPVKPTKSTKSTIRRRRYRFRRSGFRWSSFRRRRRRSSTGGCPYARRRSTSTGKPATGMKPSTLASRRRTCPYARRRRKSSGGSCPYARRRASIAKPSGNLKVTPKPGLKVTPNPGSKPEVTAEANGNVGNADSDIAAACLAAHNKYRRLHADTPDLVWDEQLAADALAWSKHQAKESNMYHQPWAKRNGQGENLYGRSTIPVDCETAVKSWYDEIKDWNFAKSASNGGVTGHFTQVVWKGSTKVGVGFAVGKYTMSGREWPWVFVTARYLPTGNMQGQYAENVGQLKANDIDEQSNATDDDNNNLPEERDGEKQDEEEMMMNN